MAGQDGPAGEVRGEAAVDSAAFEIVVAVAENDVIGRGNRLPWHLSSDLRRFKALTLGRTILMGRRTYDSIGKSLPGRTTLVLTRSDAFNPGDCSVVRTLGAAHAAVDAAEVILVVGGAEIYRQCLPSTRRMHLTVVHTVVPDGDTFFSGWRDPGWRETFREHHAADDKNTAAYSFVTLERTQPPAAAV